MRVGLLGPADGDEEALRDAIEFLLGDVDVDQAIYLGGDDGIVDAVVDGWARELFGDAPAEDVFLERAVEAARAGTPAEIRRLLDDERRHRKLARVHKLPPPPARAIEMIAECILIAVHDKKVLDEEDVVNAQLIVYGRSEEAELRRFGSRYFLTPGPLRDGRVVVLEVEPDTSITIALFETSGLPVWRETMARSTSKLHIVQ